MQSNAPDENPPRPESADDGVGGDQEGGAAEFLDGMTLADREAKWGFTLADLRAATTVVHTLFHDPSLFVGDPYLAESRLYTMITRDRKTKKENRETYKRIMSEERSRRRRYQRLQDMEAVRKTTMKREREEALNLLLQPPRPHPLLLCEAGSHGPTSLDTSRETETQQLAESALPDHTDASQWPEAQKALFRLVGAYENLLRLEGSWAGDHPAPFLEARHGAGGVSSPASPATPAASPATSAPACPPPSAPCRAPGLHPDHLRGIAVSQLTAQVYRYLPHAYGTQMPPPLLPGLPPPDAPTRGYLLAAKLHLAQLAEELAPLRPVARGGGLRGATDVVCRQRLPLPTGDARIGAARRWMSALHGDGDGDGDGDGLFASWERCGGVGEDASAAVLLRRLHVALLEGGAATWLHPADPHTAEATPLTPLDAVESALETLDLFIIRRLYGVAAVRRLGPSPVWIECGPPTSESLEPEAYSVFDDVQLYAHETASEASLQLSKWVGCYTCKVRYQLLHPYYYNLCHLCGEFNYNKRLMTADLRGKNVLLTGCRIKIGFAMALSLLRCGATLLGTTRFAHEALARFQAEADYAEWKDRLHLFSLDLRDMWVTTQFCHFVRQRYKKLYAIINNAAQTISRTPAYTASLRALEQEPPAALREELAKNTRAAEWHEFFLRHTAVRIGMPLTLEDRSDAREAPLRLTAGPQGSCFAGPPPQRPSAPSAVAPVTSLVFDRYDTAAEESDAREHNSWVMKLAEVNGGEAAEVMAINALSPFILNSKLKVCLTDREGEEDPTEPRFIINVSAMEGQFYRFKQTTHPHTNMAKAALNMMSRTSGEDYAADSIFMNSVDTGWITDDSPKSKKERRADQYMLCPLDEVDAAARCLDLIYTRSREYGKFYKDFKEIPW
eukprot:gene8323-5834_t